MSTLSGAVLAKLAAAGARFLQTLIVNAISSGAINGSLQLARNAIEGNDLSIYGSFRVYNFEVEDFHTYFVSENGVLVHNTKCVISSAMTEKILKGERIVKPDGRITNGLRGGHSPSMLTELHFTEIQLVGYK